MDPSLNQGWQEGGQLSVGEDSGFVVSVSGSSASPSPEGLEIVNYFL